MSATAPAPVYLVKGDDQSLVSQELGTLLGQLTGDAGQLAVEDHSADDPDVGAVLDACLTPPFLVDRRVVMVRELGRVRAEDADRLVGYLGAPSDTSSLLIGTTSTVPARLLDAVRKAGKVVDAGAPSGRARGQWLTARLRAASVKLDPAASAALAEHLGEDVGRLAGILSALEAAYGQGSDDAPGSIGLSELEPFLGEAGSVAPWDLTDALDGGDVAAALRALHRLVDGGARHPLAVLAILHRHYGAMLRLDGADVTSDAEAAAVLGIKSTFPAAKARAQAARLGADGIGRAITMVADADLDLRGRTALPDQLLLEVLVARLARLAPKRARGTRARSGG